MSEPGRSPSNDDIVIVDHDPRWAGAAAEERARVLDALRPLVGPLIVEHVGSTAVPGLAAKPVLDLVASVERVPLPPAALEALEQLGYEWRGEAGIPGREFFRTTPRTRHLHVVGLGHEQYDTHMLFRSYLRASAWAARRYEAAKRELAGRHRADRDAYTSGKSPVIAALVGEARAWAAGFGPLVELRAVLAGASFEWMVAGGWALELFRGEVTRPHEDVDVIVYRDDAPALQAFLLARGWRVERIVDGTYRPWAPGEPVGDDVIQVHADRADNAVGYLDFLLTPGGPLEWRYRRDARVTRSRARARHVSALGVPFLAPELALLFKSGGAGRMGVRDKDRHDADATLGRLDAEARDWLRAALALSSPEHAWLERF